MDHGWCLEILDEYGVGPNIFGLISYVCDNAELVYWASGYYGKSSKLARE